MTWGRAIKADGVLCFAALIAAGSVLVGCSKSIEGRPGAVDGAPRPPTPMQATLPEYDWLASVFPSPADLSRVLGGPEKVHEIEPLVGSVTDLRDTFAGTEISEEQCAGVSAPVEKRTYETEPVSAVAWSTQPDATLGVVALSSEQKARALFDSFVNVWQQCDGRTILKDDGTGTFKYEISRVVATDSVLSSVVVMSNSRNNRTSTIERTLGFAGDCIVDVAVPVRGASVLDNPSAKLAELMLSKIAVAPR